jgi:hypothetical protein
MSEAVPDWLALLVVVLYLVAVVYAFTLSFKAREGHRRFWIGCAVLLALGTAAVLIGAASASDADRVPPEFALGTWCVVRGRRHGRGLRRYGVPAGATTAARASGGLR